VCHTSMRGDYEHVLAHARVQLMDQSASAYVVYANLNSKMV